MYLIHEEFNPKNIRYRFFTKNVDSKDHRYFHHHENHNINSKMIANLFGSENIALVDQKHTNEVIITNDYNSYCVADGQVTNKKNIALAVATADCVPILMADEKAGVIGAVHSGWKGARTSIMIEAIKKMKNLGATEITAIIGPCIRQRSYEVSNEFYKDFVDESANYKNFFIPSIKANHYMFNLPGYVKDKLKNTGIAKILDIDRNTYEEEDKFFSFRRHTHNPESPMGNLISVIMLLDHDQ